MSRLGEAWLPNFYGEQRFGRRGENLPLAQALVRGEARVADRFKRRFLISAWQAALFNRFLSRRMEDGILHNLVVGDVMQRASSGGLFINESHELLINQARFDQRQIVPTGPMFGSRMFAPGEGTAAAAREQQILDEEGVPAERLVALGKLAEGTRRPLLVPIESPSVEQKGAELHVSFALPSGSYATVFLDELMKLPPSE